MKNVLILGHCNHDGPQIAQDVEALGAKTTRLADTKQAIEYLREHPKTVVLVNRVFTNQEEGIAFIEKESKHFPQTTFMLVSNYPEAQAKAQQVGAAPGFGKYDLHTPKIKEVLEPYLKE